MPIIPHILLETGKSPAYSIIWLHGLGADGHDFVPITDEIDLPVAVRYLFPHAPHRPVTINGGFVMRAWYDIAGTDIADRQDETGIRASQDAIEALIEQETARGIEPGNIFLAGFSQGGAIALHTALRRTVPLGGVLALSTYLPLADAASAELQPPALATPIFMAHGRSDTVIPLELAASSRARLEALGCAVEWHEYAMPHSVCEQELQDIQRWLSARME